MAGVNQSRTTLINREAQQHLQRKTNALRFAWQDTSAYEHAIAFTVAKMMDADLLFETRAAVQDALDNGTDFAAFKKRLKPYLMARGWWGQALMGDPDTGEIKKVQLGSTRRLRTIYHTNLRTAHAAGQWERIQANKAHQPYLKYIGSDAGEPREAHKRFYGMILPVDDPFWATHMPPNGWGCRCRVRALNKAQAEREGISVSPKLRNVEHINTRTGEIERYPEGVDPSFAHNPGDRLAAMRKLHADRMRLHHGSNATTQIAQFARELDSYMLELVEQPDFTGREHTVMSGGFATRFAELAEQVQKAGGTRGASMELRKSLARGAAWIVATISPSVQEQLAVQTALVQLSDDTIIKMLSHHPNESTLELFRDTRFILRNAIKIKVESGGYAVYYTAGNVNYKAVLKVTQDKREIYLTTLFPLREKEFSRELRKVEK